MLFTSIYSFHTILQIALFLGQIKIYLHGKEAIKILILGTKIVYFHLDPKRSDQNELNICQAKYGELKK